MTISLDNFLQDLQSEGQLDSKGKFTLDMGHAKEKLAGYLLEKTEDVLLKLVQTGVAAGASKLELESKATHIKFTMHGAVFPPKSLGQILNYLLGENESENRALRHLAMAVNTAVTTRPTAIALAEWDGQKEGILYRWSSKGKETLPWRPGRTAQPLATFQLMRTPEEYKGNIWHLLSQRDILSMLFGTKRGWDPDRLMIHERGCWCPIPLYMNGRLMEESPLVIGRDRATHQDTNLKHKSEFRLPCGPGSQGVRATTRKVLPWPTHEFPPGPYGAIITAGREDAWVEVPSYLELTLDGITLSRAKILGTPKDTFVRVVAAADGYKTDLPGLKLIQDQQLAQLTSWVLEHAAQMFPAAGLGNSPNLHLARV
ncbi:hypothetical protein IV102_38280 [bacterium]|nr:hypothetical protein [bacterium]